jgi:hypothetical protein
MQANGRGRHSAERFIKGYNNKMALLVFSVPPVASDMPQIYGTHRQASESFGARRCASVPISVSPIRAIGNPRSWKNHIPFSSYTAHVNHKRSDKTHMHTSYIYIYRTSYRKEPKTTCGERWSTSERPVPFLHCPHLPCLC